MRSAPEDLRFGSGGGECAAWWWRGRRDAGVPGTCVVMAHGFSLTRHDGLPAYAERFAEAGIDVLAYDPRFLGDSPGEPRQRLRPAEHREDLRSAIAFARELEGVDPERIVLWAFSMGAVAAVEAARTDDRIAALLLVAPFLDGLWRGLRTPPRATAWILPRAVADALGRHTTVPVTAPPGGRAAMTFPGEADGFARAVPEGSPWRNRISPAILLQVATLRPVRHAARITAPTHLLLAGRDVSVSHAAIERFAARAPRAELLRRPEWDHFDPFVGDGPADAADAELAFLGRHGLAAPAVATA